MRKFAIAALTIAFTTVAAHANTVASFDYGSFEVSSLSKFSLTLSLGIGADDYVSAPGATLLFNHVFANTTSGNFTFTIDNTAPNWNSVFSLLNDGNNKGISPVATAGASGSGESMTTLEFSDNFDPFVFSSPAQVATIKSIELDITGLQFSTEKIQNTTFHLATFNANVIFSDQPTAVAAPIPAAFPAGGLLLCGVVAASLHLRRRRLV